MGSEVVRWYDVLGVLRTILSVLSAACSWLKWLAFGLCPRRIEALEFIHRRPACARRYARWALNRRTAASTITLRCHVSVVKKKQRKETERLLSLEAERLGVWGLRASRTVYDR